ncbi:MAG: signal peptidase I [Actinomycetales bacterium]
MSEPVRDDQPAAELPEEVPQQRPRRRSGLVAFLRETAIVLVTAIVLSLLIKTFLVQAYFIPSGSMESTLEVNDRVLVSLLEPGPFALDRGDIIVFKDPGDWLGGQVAPTRSAAQQTVVNVLTFIGVFPHDSGKHLIKRIIGLPGDHVVCCDADGRITVNGVGLDEDYLDTGTEPSAMQFDVVVPDDSVWVMGDNRDESADSRYHQDLNKGALKEEFIVGRAVLLFWPFSRFTTLSNHERVFADVPTP